jgi:hypothetical protein
MSGANVMLRGICVFLVCLLAPAELVAQDVLLIHGTVLKEDNQPFQNPINLIVLARRSGDPNPILATIVGSTYDIRVPALRAQDASIWTIEFSEDTRHPGSLCDISGPSMAEAPRNSFVHKMDKILLPENGPVGYKRNVEQLLEYERLFYDRTGEGVPANLLKQKYGAKLIHLPDIFDETDIPEIAGATSRAQNNRESLWKLRYHVFDLYGVPLPELITQGFRRTTWNTTYTALDGRAISATMRLTGATGTYSLAGQNAAGTLSNVGYFVQPNGDILIVADWSLNGIIGTVEFRVPSGNKNSFSGTWVSGGQRGSWTGVRTK